MSNRITYVADFTNSRAVEIWRMQADWGSRTLASPWLVAHDLFQHDANESGLVQEELRTLGAEMYIELESPWMADLTEIPENRRYRFRNFIRTAGVVLHLPFEDGSAEPVKYRFSDVAVADAGLNQFVQMILGLCAQSVIDERDDMVEQGGMFEEFLPNLSTLTYQIAYNTLVDGYLRAKARFPVQEDVQLAYKQAVIQLTKITDAAHRGQTLTVERKGLALLITP